MNTEQNYVGRGNYANTPPPMAQNEAQTPSTPDDWRSAILELKDFLIKSKKRVIVIVIDNSVTMIGNKQIGNNNSIGSNTTTHTSQSIGSMSNSLATNIGRNENKTDVGIAKKGGVSNG